MPLVVQSTKQKLTTLEIAQTKIDHAQEGATPPTRLNQVQHGQTPRGGDVNPPTRVGVAFTFHLATPVNDLGRSSLTYTVDVDPQVKGTTTKQVTFVVSGFETQVQATKRIATQAKIDAAQTKTDVSPPTRLNQVLHGQTPGEADVNPPTRDGVTFTFHSATPVNDLGKSSLTYTVVASPQVKGTTTKEVIFILGGFETRVQKNAREIIKNQLDSTFQKMRGGILIIPEGITSSQFDEYVKTMGGIKKFAEKYQARITSLTIPNSFTTLGNWFQDFNRITTLTLGTNLQTIKAFSFFAAPLSSLTIPVSVTTIGDQVFQSSPLATITIFEDVTLGKNVFMDSTRIIRKARPLK